MISGAEIRNKKTLEAFKRLVIRFSTTELVNLTTVNRTSINLWKKAYKLQGITRSVGTKPELFTKELNALKAYKEDNKKKCSQGKLNQMIKPLKGRANIESLLHRHVDNPMCQGWI